MTDISLFSNDELLNELIDRSEYIVACLAFKGEAKKEQYHTIFNGDYIQKAGAAHQVKQMQIDSDLNLRDDNNRRLKDLDND